jgi:hypothetical protein
MRRVSEMELFAKDVAVGDVIDGSVVFSIINHPSGLVFCDVFGNKIMAVKRDATVLMEIL